MMRETTNRKAAQNAMRIPITPLTKSDGLERARAGFTMMEALLAVVILTIVAGLVFVNVTQYQRSMYQREMDEVAKEIYVAAQNHAIIADNLGSLAGKSQGAKDAASGHDDIYYYIVPQDRASLDNRKSMLGTMLPPRSIDDTVRANGSYVLRYQANAGGVRVLDVFYADPHGQFGYTFAASDFNVLFYSDEDYRDAGETGSEARAKFNGDDGAVIGYYGGEEGIDEKASLPIPRIEVENAEELKARLTNPSDFTGHGVSYKIDFYVTGVTSGATCLVGTVDPSTQYLDVIIDSITREKSHFAELDSDNDKIFLPGENIRVQAFAMEVEGTGVSKSARRTTNSLFASLGSKAVQDLLAVIAGDAATGDAEAGGATPNAPQIVRISNIRHLENLDKAMSGFDDEGIAGLNIGSYEQTSDLSWLAFKDVVGTNSTGGNFPGVYALGSAEASQSFAPINWSSTANKLAYQGNSLVISDVDVNVSGNAGLFGTVSNAEISNLELVNFSVKSSAGVAGALVGSMTGSTATGVVAHNVVGQGVLTGADNDASLEITGATNAGGLVGALSGGKVEQSAAAVYVRSTGEGAAGGLVGSATNTTIQQSYAGGHTTNKVDVDTTDDGITVTNEGNTGFSKQTEAGVASRMNVIAAAGAAGGLVGNSSNATIDESYSTCSASGGTAAGGLVGNVVGGEVANSYALGLVTGSITDEDGVPTGAIGAFIGSLGTGVELADTNRYFGIVNYDVEKSEYLPAVGSDAKQEVERMDKDATALRADMPSTASAKPYDSALEDLYQGKYPFKSIAQLAGLESSGALPAHVATHYGDWPAPETLVINTKSSS